MAFDALTMTVVAGELQKAAIGARVQRIIQPSREEIILMFYRPGEESSLLLSSHPHHARVHLTRQRCRQQGEPPPFCMLLRKYLTGARISAVSQPHLERILTLHFEAHEGLPAVCFIAEIMGRRSNLLLIDSEGIILGAIKTATREQNPRRAIMPGLPYEEVPLQSKLDPSETKEDGLAAAMLPLLAEGKDPEEALLKTVRAVSPQVARELIYRSRWEDQAPGASLAMLHRELTKLFSGVAHKAFLYPGLGAYASYPLTHLRDATFQEFDQMNDLLDHFYQNLMEKEEIKILKGQLGARVNRRKKRLEQKLGQFEAELKRAGESDHYRIYGETLLTYGSMIKGRTEEATLPHLYRMEEAITIPLDPSLDAMANAREYFRIYRKISNSRKHLQKQISRLQQELAYCSELLYTIERADRSSLGEIGEELVSMGYMKPLSKSSSRQKKRERSEKPQPLAFTSTAGNRILVGQNNRQNDYLTFKIAARRDIWLHAQGLPGSHVIIKTEAGPPLEEDLLEAALLSAYFSRGRDLSTVAVDYTEVRHVRRAPGAKPGFVLYNPFQTITVSPHDERIKRLLE